MVSRRKLIKLGLYGGGAGLLHLAGAGSNFGWALDSGNNLPPSPPSKPFQVPLPIPQVKAASGIAYVSGVPSPLYQITMKQAPVQILPGQKNHHLGL